VINLKRGQGLPLNTIIIAAIVLIVLVIIILIFTGRIGGFNRDVQSCANNGGQCVDSCGDNQRQASFSCDNNGDGIFNEAGDGVCCIGVG